MKEFTRGEIKVSLGGEYTKTDSVDGIENKDLSDMFQGALQSGMGGGNDIFKLVGGGQQLANLLPDSMGGASGAALDLTAFLPGSSSNGSSGALPLCLQQAGAGDGSGGSGQDSDCIESSS